MTARSLTHSQPQSPSSALADLKAIHQLHLVGAGGAGMSALAKLLSGQGWTVTGSDIRASETLVGMRDVGIEVWAGHQPDRIHTAELVVASSAVPDQDPELATAREQGIPVWRRPQLLSAISARQPTVGATGTHGKTTTTTLIAEIFRAAGQNPSVVVGAEMIKWGSNAVVGSDPWLVLEVDEAFSTFSYVQLAGLVVTNVDDDHISHFGTLDDLENAFVEVVRGVDGPVLICIDDPGSAQVAERTGAETYGTHSTATFRLTNLSPGIGQISFQLESPYGPPVPVTMPRAGQHMALNAAGALALAIRLGIPAAAASRGISQFGGVRRRFEHKGTIKAVTIVDDYAHHPTEITSTIKAARSSHAGRIMAVFQPHLYSRTKQLQHKLGQSLALADRVVVTDVFAARESPIPGISGELVAAAAQRVGAAVDYIPGQRDLLDFLCREVKAGDLVITMGAGDINVVADQLVHLLGQGPV